MSKMNENSRKSSKKVSKKNFKIENLEPRLMMDAASGFEVEKLDAYAEQFESLSATIGDEVTKAIDSVSNFDISSLGISEKIDSVTSLLSDSAEKFKATVVENVSTVLNNAIENAKQEIEAFNAAIDEKIASVEASIDDKISKVSLSEFVNKYVADYLASVNGEKYKGLEFSVDGTKLVVSLDLSNTKSLEGMGFDLGSLGEMKLDVI